MAIMDLKEGSHFSGKLRVVEKTLNTAKNGKPYIRFRLADKSGTISGKQWSASDLSPYEGFVEVEANVEAYQGNLELSVVDARRVDPETIRIEDFLPSVEGDIGEMVGEFQEYGQELRSDLRDFAAEVFEGERLSLFVKAPAATSYHHACIGGLLEHSLSMVQMAVGLGLPERFHVDADLLKLGAMVHDIGKIEEYGIESGFDRTTRGRLLGHITLGVMMLEGLFPSPRPVWADHLLHLVASHHGKRDWGSPVEPATPEALVLHQLDMVDSRLQAAAEALAQPGASEWTVKVPMLDTPIYRGHGKIDHE